MRMGYERLEMGDGNSYEYLVFSYLISHLTFLVLKQLL